MSDEFAGLTPIASAAPQAAPDPEQDEFHGLSVIDPQQAAEAQNDAKYGGALEGAKALAEQTASGATLGGSKVLETKMGLTTPEALAGREAAHPALSFLGNLAGTAALLSGTGGAGLLGEGAGVAAKVGVGALEGAGIGGINQVTDDWSQNKPLDAQKIAASAGLGALLGGTGTAVVEGGAALFRGIRGIKAEIPPGAADGAPPSGGGGSGEPLLSNTSMSPEPPAPPAGKLGVQPTSLDDILGRIATAKADPNAVAPPAQDALIRAISRVEMEHPVSPLQMDALASSEASDIYGAAKEMPGKVGQALKGYEAMQKAELVGKVLGTVQDLAPGAEMTGDAVKGGEQASDAFTKQYQAEKDALKPLLEGHKAQALGVNEDHLPGMVYAMAKEVPGIANMFDTTAGDFTAKPYKSSWGIDKVTYNAVKEAVDSLQDNPGTVRELLNVREGLKQHANVLDQGAGPGQIRSLGKGAMDYIQDTAADQTIRPTLKRYAINEQQRGVIEKTFGASVGSPEFGAISKVKPEYIGDKIFGNTATVKAAKSILPPEEFQKVLGNWLSTKIGAVIDKGAFSSNKFARFLRSNEDVLNTAFADNPAALQRLHDLTTIMRILPDNASINPSGTAKTLLHMMSGLKLHDMTWEGMLASIPQKVMGHIQGELQVRDINNRLAGTAARNNATRILQKRVSMASDDIRDGTKAIFAGAASQARKVSSK